MKKINIIELNFFIARYSFIQSPPPASPSPRRSPIFSGRGGGGEVREISTRLKKINSGFRFCPHIIRFLISSFFGSARNLFKKRCLDNKRIILILLIALIPYTDIKQKKGGHFHFGGAVEDSGRSPRLPSAPQPVSNLRRETKVICGGFRAGSVSGSEPTTAPAREPPFLFFVSRPWGRVGKGEYMSVLRAVS